MRYVLAAALFAAQWVYASSPSIEVVGLFKNGAVLLIDGKQRMLRQGANTVEGIKVLKANAKFVILDVNGETKKLSLSKKIGTHFAEAAKAEVRISSGSGGHYWTPGRINNRPCEFVVDTGATFVSMSSEHAQALGLSYKEGAPVTMRTANGVKRSYKINIDSVSVGSVTVRGVEAVVSEGRFPDVILLGNAFLKRVEMRVEAGVMVLQSRI